jgi:hypothetical protein
LEAIAGRFPVELYDSNRPFADLLRDVDVVRNVTAGIP